MPIAQLTHTMQYLGQVMQNRYFYRTAGVINVAALDDLLSEFNTEVVGLVKAMQHSSVSHLTLEAFSVGGVTFSSLNLTGNGTNGDEPLPSYVALTFQLQRGSLATRSGSKRIGGISESWVIGNDIWDDPTIEAAIEAYSEVLDDALTGSTSTWTPVLVRFDPTDHTVILAEQLVVGGIFKRVSTQNSRKAES